MCVFVLFSVYLYALYLLLQYGKQLAVTGHLSTHTTCSTAYEVCTCRKWNTIASGDDLSPNRLQVKTGTNDDAVLQHPGILLH